MKRRLISSLALTFVCVVLGILISLQMKNVNARAATTDNLEDMQRTMLEYVRKNEELNDRNMELANYVEQLVSDRAKGDAGVEAILREWDRAARFAGLTDAENEGVVIRISAGPDQLMRDSVLRLFTNELSSLGAQAISINDERRVAMTEIRVSNEDIIVNGRAFKRNEPFVIKAITDPEKETYILGYLERLRSSVLEELAGENYEITVRAEQQVFIPKLREDSIAFKTDLLSEPTGP